MSILFFNERFDSLNGKESLMLALMSLEFIGSSVSIKLINEKHKA